MQNTRRQAFSRPEGIKRMHADMTEGLIATVWDDGVRVMGQFIGPWCYTDSAVAQEGLIVIRRRTGMTKL